MVDFWSAFVSSLSSAMAQANALTLWEAIAVVLAMAYLLLAMRGSIWCWSAAFFSTAIYTVLFWEVSLLMESVLNIYYMAMAVYGYWMWSRGRGDDKGVVVVSWSLSRHSLLIGITTLASLMVGYLMANYTQAAFPYLDAATTCFAVMTTYLVAKKVLENWLYWVVIDVVSIYLYLNKGLMLTSLLFILYVGMAIGGYFLWRTTMRNEQQSANGQYSYE
ncbi:nicotinamide riboside transporter PnuC [Shewanella colwelliana]|uniref:Nicotinamide riboside transporter PnuC n=1 Tax=Shewanella colwelliana TaxID=23 RepID=A0A1E5INM0_SHECO|nr:nicotinamide riboside transporter PnuC [Shewanella colwelliana]OEG72089.1 nicotinamide mononucleotide transporter [Shewanella colwelliana]GIU39601.1 nicotinamide mononucleotide transporter [Shewanella colwelliana]